MEAEQMEETNLDGNIQAAPSEKGAAKARGKKPKAAQGEVGRPVPGLGEMVLGENDGKGEAKPDLSVAQARREAQALVRELETREKEYSISESNWGQKPGKKYVPEQKDLVETFMKRRELGKKFFLYQGGNGSGKSLICSYITACLAIPDEWKIKLGLPMLGKKRSIFIGTKSGQNVKNVISPYLVGEGSKCRIPPALIERIGMDNGILKSITMKDGTTISVYTYDAGREIWQGANPDFMWLDEEPTDSDIWHEALARTRTIGKDGESCPLLISMTPLSGPGTPVLEYFHEQGDEEVKAKCASWLVSSLSNPFADSSLSKSFKGYEYQQRVLGVASVPTGLVYHEFRRTRNVVPHFDPYELGEGVRFFAGIDWGVTHPTGISVMAVDLDGNHYVFDTWKKSNASLREIADQFKLMTSKYELSGAVSDSAAKRERFELQDQFGIRLTPADKASKGENGESNRRAGILHINQMMADGKFMVSDRCRDLIREYETHYYKDTEKDGVVVKDNDDINDSVRYAVFHIKKIMSRDLKSGPSERSFREQFQTSSKNAIRAHNGNVTKIKIRY